MRDNPNPEADPSELLFAGDNFSRISGDAVGLAQTQVFAWDIMGKTGGTVVGREGATGTSSATAAAASIHPQANPSQTEMMKKKFTNEAVDLVTKQKRAVLSKYGGAEYLDGDGGLGSAAKDTVVSARDADRAAEERKARFGVTVQEEHFTLDGRSAKAGATGTKVVVNLKSKYDEDVMINGHTSVWGSFFHKGAFRWGYTDDHSLLKNSYCTGLNGRIANDEANELKFGTGVAGSAALAQAREMLKAIPQADKGKGLVSTRLTNSKMYGEADQFASFDKEKLKAAMLQEEEHSTKRDENKRKYNSLGSEVDVTEEQMEAYRLKKGRSDDPMAKLGTDEILDYKK